MILLTHLRNETKTVTIVLNILVILYSLLWLYQMFTFSIPWNNKEFNKTLVEFIYGYISHSIYVSLMRDMDIIAMIVRLAISSCWS